MPTRPVAARVAFTALAAAAVLSAGLPASAGTTAALTNGAELTVPVGGLGPYDYKPELVFWSVTGVRPSAGAKSDLYLYADEANLVRLAESKFKRKAVDFIAVDANHAPLDRQFPTVKSGGTGTYTVELDDDAQLLFTDSPVRFQMGPSDVVVVIDTYLELGVDYTITVQPGDPSQDAGLFLMQSDAADPSTYYQSRGEALLTGNRKGAGAREMITVTGTDDWYGVVLANNAGSGTYNLIRTGGVPGIGSVDSK